MTDWRTCKACGALAPMGGACPTCGAFGIFKCEAKN